MPLDSIEFLCYAMLCDAVLCVMYVLVTVTVSVGASDPLPSYHAVCAAIVVLGVSSTQFHFSLCSYSIFTSFYLRAVVPACPSLCYCFTSPLLPSPSILSLAF